MALTEARATWNDKPGVFGRRCFVMSESWVNG